MQKVCLSTFCIPFHIKNDSICQDGGASFIGDLFLEEKATEWETLYDTTDALSSRNWKAKALAWTESFRLELWSDPPWIHTSSKQRALLSGLPKRLKEIILSPTQDVAMNGIPTILVDWQIQYTQHVLPLFLFGWNKGVASVRREKQSFLLEPTMIRHLQASLLIGLLQDKGARIASLKTHAKQMLKHVMTAKNRQVPIGVGGELDVRRCFIPETENGHYRPPYSWESRIGTDSSVSSSSDDDCTQYKLTTPSGMGGRLIHDTQVSIIAMAEKKNVSPKKILELSRFLWQSRANTVADATMQGKSLLKWVNALTRERVQPTAETFMNLEALACQVSNEALDRGFKLPVTTALLVNNSGKLDSSVKEGGTAGALQRRFTSRLKEPVSRIDLATFKFEGEAIDPGDKVVSLLVQDILEDVEYVDDLPVKVKEGSNLLRFDAISIAEISKSRTASLSATLLVELLNLVGEIGLEAMRLIPESKDSMRGGNLAFSFLKGLTDHDDFVEHMDSSWMVFSSDLSEATDSGLKTVARCLLQSFFCKSVYDPVRALITLAIFLFCENMVFKSPITGEDDFAVNGWLMGLPLTKFLLALVNVCCFRLAKIQVPQALKPYGSFNGDDAIFICLCGEFITVYLDWIRKVGLKTSWDDTFVSIVDRMYIYSEEVGQVPQHLLMMPNVASVIKSPSLTSDVLVPRRKLTVPYAKGLGWKCQSRGRHAAAAIEASYMSNNPSASALIRFWQLPTSVLPKPCNGGKYLPCIDSRLGGNDFPLPFCNEVTMRSAIQWQISNGLTIRATDLYAFLAAPSSGSDWKQFRGLKQRSLTETALTSNARSWIQPRPENFGHEIDEQTLCSLLLRTKEYVHIDVHNAQILALSRYESIFLGEEQVEPDTVLEESPEMFEIDRKATASVQSVLLSAAYLNKVKEGQEGRQRLNTARTTDLVPISGIGAELKKFRVRLLPEPDRDDQPTVAEQLLSFYRNDDWLGILNLIREYRFPTDPVLWAVARITDGPTEVFTLDRDLINKMNKRRREAGKSELCRYMHRSNKKAIILAGLERCCQPTTEIDDLHREMIQLISVRTRRFVSRLVRTIGNLYRPPVEILSDDDEETPTEIVSDDDRHYKLPNIQPLFDWGHLKVIAWTLDLGLLDGGDSVLLSYRTKPSLSSDRLELITQSSVIE